MTKAEPNAQNLAAHEWMGLYARVVRSTDPHRTGLSGRMVKETRNTIAIETKNGVKIMPKTEVVLEVSLPDKSCAVLETAKWAVRPEDRIKAFAKKSRGKR